MGGHLARPEERPASVEEVPEDLFDVSDEARLPSLFPSDRPELLDCRDEDGFTPLMHASRSGRLAVVEYLLSRGADPSLESPTRATPLHLAAANGFREVCEALLRRGAPADAARGHTLGRTPAMEAFLAGHLDLAPILRFAEDHQVRSTVILVLLLAHRRGSPFAALSRHQLARIIEFLIPPTFSFNLQVGLFRNGTASSLWAPGAKEKTPAVEDVKNWRRAERQPIERGPRKQVR